MVASKQPRRRDHGFWLFLPSNILWAGWGLSAHAWALLVLQFGLAFADIRGVTRNRASRTPGA